MDFRAREFYSYQYLMHFIKHTYSKLCKKFMSDLLPKKNVTVILQLGFSHLKVIRQNDRHFKLEKLAEKTTSKDLQERHLTKLKNDRHFASLVQMATFLRARNCLF